MQAVDDDNVVNEKSSCLLCYLLISFTKLLSAEM